MFQCLLQFSNSVRREEYSCAFIYQKKKSISEIIFVKLKDQRQVDCQFKNIIISYIALI